MSDTDAIAQRAASAERWFDLMRSVVEGIAELRGQVAGLRREIAEMRKDLDLRERIDQVTHQTQRIAEADEREAARPSPLLAISERCLAVVQQPAVIGVAASCLPWLLWAVGTWLTGADVPPPRTEIPALAPHDDEVSDGP